MIGKLFGARVVYTAFCYITIEFVLHLLKYMLMIKAITRIHKVEIFSFRFGDAFVHGLINTIIGLTDPIGYMVSIFSYYIDTTVCRASIDNNVLVVFTRLREYAFDGCFQTILVIIVDGNNGVCHIRGRLIR